MLDSWWSDRLQVVTVKQKAFDWKIFPYYNDSCSSIIHSLQKIKGNMYVWVFEGREYGEGKALKFSSEN